MSLPPVPGPVAAGRTPLRPSPELVTDRLVLRIPRRDEAELIRDFHRVNAEFLQPWSPTRDPAVDSVDYWRDKIHTAHEECRQDLAVRLTLFDRMDRMRVHGTASFTSIVRGVAQFCYLGYSLAETSQGKGYMTEALRGAIAYAFGPLDLHRIMANYMPRNERSARVLSRLGFEREGLARGYLRINGVWEDHILTSLVNPSWNDSPPRRL